VAVKVQVMSHHGQRDLAYPWREEYWRRRQRPVLDAGKQLLKPAAVHGDAVEDEDAVGLPRKQVVARSASKVRH
jgi:hypothetical protein